MGYGLVCTDYIKLLGGPQPKTNKGSMNLKYSVAGEKTSVCGGAHDLSMVLPAQGPLGFTFRSDDSHVRTLSFTHSFTHLYHIVLI